MEDEETILDRLFPAIFTVLIYIALTGVYHIEQHTFALCKKECKALIWNRKNEQEKKSIWFCYNTLRKFFGSRKIGINSARNAVTNIVRKMSYATESIPELSGESGKKYCIRVAYNMIVYMITHGKSGDYSPACGIYTRDANRILFFCIEWLSENGENKERLEKKIPYADIKFYE